MKKENIRIQEVKVPPIAEEDILQTIWHAKEIVNEEKWNKWETSKWKIIKEVVFRYDRKSILFQLGCIISALLFLWILINNDDQTNAMALFLTSSIIFSISLIADTIRSQIYNMQEIEQSCPYSLKQLWLWKVLLLSSMSLIAIAIASYLLTRISGLQMSTLLYGGCIPFFLINGFNIQMQRYYNNTSVLIGVYVGVLALVMSISIYAYMDWLAFLQTYGMYGAMISGFYMLYMLYQQQVKEQSI